MDPYAVTIRKSYFKNTQKSHKKIPLPITQRISALNHYWVMVGTELSMAAHVMVHLLVQIKLDLRFLKIVSQG